MLIEFKVGNFLSFKEVVTLSMEAARIKELPENTFTAPDKKTELLKSAIVYGPNGSGKSNLIKALYYFKRLVVDSSKQSSSSKVTSLQFKLSTETTEQPSFFEITFVANGIRYRYGFEADYHQFKSEWLYAKDKTKEKCLFMRNKSEFNIHSSLKEVRMLSGQTLPNMLFLSKIDQANNLTAKTIISWFNRLTIISGLTDEHNYKTIDKEAMLKNKTLVKLNEEGVAFQTKLSKLLRFADVGVERVFVHKTINTAITPKDFMPTDGFPEEKTVMLLGHKILTGSNKLYAFAGFPLIWESEGTQRIFLLAGDYIETLEQDTILVIDEFEDRFHSRLSMALLEAFHSVSKKAQLIITTHDTNLLQKFLFRRDQIWFLEKDNCGASDLFSLVEFKDVRNDASFEKDYLTGKYGGIPNLGDFVSLFKHKGDNK